MGPVGAIVMSSFAFLFCVLAQINGAPMSRETLAVPFVVSLTLVIVAFRQYGRGLGGRTSEDERIGRVIMWSSAAEGLGIFLAVNVLRNVGMAERVMSGIAAVVGLHFLPMARLIPFPRFYALAAALLVIAATSILMSPGAGALVAGVGAATALWLAAALALMPVQKSRERAGR